MQTERQLEIIETALDLIKMNGIQGFTIKNLAQKIGISEPAIYRHYENKVQILMAVLDSFGSVFRKVKDNTEKEKSSLLQIEAMFTSFFESFNDDPSLVAVIFSEELFRNEPKLSEKTAQIINQNIDFLSTIIENGRKNNEIRRDISANHLAIMVMGTLRLYVKKWQFSNYSFDLNSEGNKLIQSVVNLLSI